VNVSMDCDRDRANLTIEVTPGQNEKMSASTSEPIRLLLATESTSNGASDTCSVGHKGIPSSGRRFSARSVGSRWD
jgi:hypothetical protein